MSNFAVLVASFGVLLLLLAFALNLVGVVQPGDLNYQLLNMVGAGLSAFASVLIGFIPFVILEGLWMIVAGAAIVNGLAGRVTHREPESYDGRSASSVMKGRSRRQAATRNRSKDTSRLRS